MGTVPAGRTAKLTSDPRGCGDHSQGAREEGHETGGTTTATSIMCLGGDLLQVFRKD